MAVPSPPITMPKTARPMPCFFGSLRMARMASTPVSKAKGAGMIKTENNPRYPDAIAQPEFGRDEA